MKPMSIIVQPDGKIEVPAEVQKAVGFGPGTVLEIQAQAGTLVAWKKVGADAFEKMAWLPGSCQ
jgi:hypothetical protein